MKHNKKDIENLIIGYLNNSLDEDEKGQLQQWLDKSERHKNIFNHLKEEENLTGKYDIYESIDYRKAWAKFKKDTKIEEQSRWKYVLRFAAMLIIPLSVIGALSYYFVQSKLSDETQIAQTITPGSLCAQLQTTVSSGNSLVSPVVHKSIIKDTLICNEASIKHDNAKSEKSKEEPLDNKLTTHRGHEFWVRLEDGTSIHLNYNTEIKYPVSFSSKMRYIYLNGEAYFKIAKDERPFYVITDNGTIKQYGTEFNVNTFNKGTTEVVLIKGSISVYKDDAKEVFLQPGQLANINKSFNNVHIENVDVTPFIAWNQGRLIFEDKPLGMIASILERWYNVDVIFDNPELRKLHFTGNMDRYGNINPILDAIARTTTIQYSIKDRKIYITK